MVNKLIFTIALLLVATGAWAQTPTATATATNTATATPTAPVTPTTSPTATPATSSQYGYKPDADYYGYRWYTFATLPASPAPFASYATTLKCLDCTKTNPAAQGVVNNPPITCVWANHWDCSGGLLWGRCINIGTVTSDPVISFNDSSCKVLTTATSGLSYWLNVGGMRQDEDVVVYSYISGNIGAGPLWQSFTGSHIAWLQGTAPVSSTTSGYLDIIYLHFNGTELVETGEAIGVN